MQIITEIFSTIPGTTSAYAENTCLDSLAHRRGRNYLRVRGEYLGVAVEGLIGPELPPRTRRIRRLQGSTPEELGTTSAYAENTMIRFSMLTDLGNYLRVRGEYSMTVTDQFAQAELPPRTRRIPSWRLPSAGTMRTTSAYAENTSSAVSPTRWRRNYLRVRGEYPGTRP